MDLFIMMKISSCAFMSLLYLLTSVQCAPVVSIMCVNPGSELATLDAPCTYDSNCTTLLCQDGMCGCPRNHYYDSCKHACQAENDEADQIVAMKAGTTAVGTFILIVVFVIIAMREKNKDDAPKVTSKPKATKVALDHFGQKSQKTSLEKLKQPQTASTVQRNGGAPTRSLADIDNLYVHKAANGQPVHKADDVQHVHKADDGQHVHKAADVYSAVYDNAGYTADIPGEIHHYELITRL